MSTTSQARDQHLRALERANAIRLARAELRHRIERGEVFAASVLLDPPAEAANWPVGQLVITQRYWGTTKMRRVLGRLQIAEGKPVGLLTDRQRRVLARALGWQEEEE